MRWKTEWKDYASSFLIGFPAMCTFLIWFSGALKWKSDGCAVKEEDVKAKVKRLEIGWQEFCKKDWVTTVVLLLKTKGKGHNYRINWKIPEHYL